MSEPGIREKQKQKTRATIAAAAFDLFTTKSFDQVTVEEIAVQAGVAKGTVFHHFETKTDLALGAIAYFAEEELKEMDSVFHAANPEDAIKQFVDASFALVYERPGLTQLMLSLTSLAQNVKSDTQLSQKLHEFTESFMSTIYQQMAEFFGDGARNELHAEALARVFIGLLDGLGLQLLIEGIAKNDPIIPILKDTMTQLLHCLVGGTHHE